jgi:hypothetical protein
MKTAEILVRCCYLLAIAALLMFNRAGLAEKSGFFRFNASTQDPCAKAWPLPFLPSSERGIDAYEKVLSDFVNKGCYKTSPGWKADSQIRDTGPYIGGKKYGTHNAVKVCRLTAYNKSSHRGFAGDLAAAQYICELSGISVGAIDFIGDRINEINGCGTVMTTMDQRRLFVDTRPAFINYLLKLMN